MSLISFNGIPQRAIQGMYHKTQTNFKGEEYKIDASGKDAELEKLQERLDKGLISESQYKFERQAIESAPETFFIDAQTQTPKEVEMPQDTESFISSQQGMLEVEHEMMKLRNQLLSGQISDFTYRANQALLTTPPPTSNEHILNIKA